MYQDINVIPCMIWVHTSGRQASIYGAVPWTSEADKPNWQCEQRGWTWECVDRHGSVTVGLCRKPAETYEEAEAIRDKVLAM